MFRDSHTAAGMLGRLNRIGCCSGITSTPPPSTVVLFGNRIAATMARCQSKGMKIGIFGLVLWSTAGNLRTCREVFFDYRQAEQSMITRTRGFESQIEAFVASKHGLLYRRQWQQQRREHESVKGICRDIGKMARISIWRDIHNSPAKDGKGAAIDSAAI